MSRPPKRQSSPGPPLITSLPWRPKRLSPRLEPASRSLRAEPSLSRAQAPGSSVRVSPPSRPSVAGGGPGGGGTGSGTPRSTVSQSGATESATSARTVSRPSPQLTMSPLSPRVDQIVARATGVCIDSLVAAQRVVARSALERIAAVAAGERRAGGGRVGDAVGTVATANGDSDDADRRTGRHTAIRRRPASSESPLWWPRGRKV